MSRKVLVVASGGGHWIQLRRLEPAFDGLDVVYVSVRPAYAEDVPTHRFYAVQDATRWDRLKLLKLIGQMTRILLIERPHTVITTGAAPGMVALMLGKLLLRARTMWIDSIANAEKMSGSGILSRRFADAWLTQWPNLETKEGPQYWGAVL